MADQAVQIKIGSDVEGFRRGATEAKSHADSLIEKLREFKSEQVSQARTARFFAMELLEIVPAADGAKSAIQGLLNVGLAGGGMAAVFEGALFVARQIGTAWQANGETIKKATDDAAKAINELDERVKAYIASTKKETEAEKLRREVIEPLEKTEAAQKEELRALTDRLALATNKVTEAQNAQGRSAELVYRGQAESLAALVKEKERDLGLTQARITAAKVEVKDVAGADKVEQAKKNSADYAASWGKAVDEQMANDEKLLNEQAAQSKEWVELKKKSMDEYFASVGKATDEQMAQDEKAATMVAEAAQKRIAEHAKFVKGMVTELGRSFADVFKGMIRGTLDLGEALKNLGLGVVDMIIDALVKLAAQAVITAIIGKSAAATEAIGSTAGHTAAAAAGAAESMAFIPLVGPGLAAAAAAEMVATLGAITGPLLAVASAAGGMLVPQDMPAFLHKDERVIPARYSEGLDEMVLNGGGGDLHVHVHGAIDGDSVRRVINSPVFVRELRDAYRRGRL